MHPNETHPQIAERQIIERLHTLEPTRRQRVLRNLVATALGSIPWVGGFVTAIIASRDESAQLEIDSLQRQWLQEHQSRMEKLACDLAALTSHLDSIGDKISERLESESYLALVRKAFRLWDQTDTDQKRQYIGKLLANAAASKLCEDDLIRLFLDWLALYHESHFKVIREVFQNPGSTRHQIWERIHGEFPPDNSPEADLFRMLIGDLSQGRIIRQQRKINTRGQFLKKSRGRLRREADESVILSAFDDAEPYELTELGKQFVCYVFSESVEQTDTAD